MTMDYSPWVESEIWPFFRVAISPKLERPRPPKLVHMHNSSILTCIYFLGRFQSIKFFDDHGPKGNFFAISELRISVLSVDISNVNT